MAPAVPLAPLAPFATQRSRSGMVASIDMVASSAGVALMRAGGNAVDAAVGASAVLAVVAQHTCGMGGDLWALVHVDGSVPPAALNASGRAGSGSSADALRTSGRTTMPMRHTPGRQPVSVTVPGCVDGWTTLHGRFGVLPLAEVLAPAIDAARNGFALSVGCAAAVADLAGVAHSDDYTAAAAEAGAPVPGTLVRRLGVADALEQVATGGRDAFYRGDFGEDVIALGDGLFTADDLARTQADWVEPISTTAWRHEVFTTPPNSQGYAILASAQLAEQQAEQPTARLGLPGQPSQASDTGDARWVHVLAEAARQAAYDRPDVLSEVADPAALLSGDQLEARLAAMSATGTHARPEAHGDVSEAARRSTDAPDTCYLAAVDANRMGVSLIASNAAGWGARLFTPTHRISLHNRGIGFNLVSGHPAELAPGRRPPHTLAPALVRRPSGELAAVLGTMGGDAQPQVVLQLLARLLAAKQSPADAVAAPRWRWAVPDAGGFGTWSDPSRLQLLVEGHGAEVRASTGAADLVSALRELGHDARAVEPFDAEFGHAHVVTVDADGTGALAGASDPRASGSAVVGY